MHNQVRPPSSILSLSLSLQQGRAAAGPAAAGDGRRGRGRQGGQGEGKPLMDGWREVHNVKLSEIGSWGP